MGHICTLRSQEKVSWISFTCDSYTNLNMIRYPYTSILCQEESPFNDLSVFSIVNYMSLITTLCHHGLRYRRIFSTTPVWFQIKSV